MNMSKSQAKQILTETKRKLINNYGEYVLSIETLDVAIDSIKKLEELEKAIENAKKIDLDLFCKEYVKGFKDSIDIIELYK